MPVSLCISEPTGYHFWRLLIYKNSLISSYVILNSMANSVMYARRMMMVFDDDGIDIHQIFIDIRVSSLLAIYSVSLLIGVFTRHT